MEIDQFIAYVQQIDFPTLIVMGFMLWFFKSRMDMKFEKMDQKLEKIETRLNEIDKRLVAVETRLNEMDKRLVAVETTIRIQGACALKESRIQEKAL